MPTLSISTSIQTVGSSTASALCLCLALAIPSAARSGTAPNGPHTLSGHESTVVMKFDTLSGRSINADSDASRVDSLTFPYDYQENTNLAATEAAGGPNHCHDPDEYVGQALGYPNASQAPLMVASGQRASWSKLAARDNSVTEAKTFTGLATCPGTSVSGLTRTVYRLNQYRVNGVRIDRTLRFKYGLGVLPNTGLRAYVPRVISAFHYVLVPNAAGTVVRYDANNCTAAPCTITDWNGKRVSDNFGNGFGLIIVRDPSSTAPAFVGIQSGGASNSNFTSIVLSQPARGWSGTITETAYLCYYTIDNRAPAANTLPGGCAITTPNGH